MSETYDVVVIGAGHAGCEAALSCARMGLNTLLTTMNLDALALMPCNPAIGGTAKGHLVREVDALGGEMGRAIDDTLIQSRMLNTAKGARRSHPLRAQADKKNYQLRMRRAVDEQPRLVLRQAEVCRIETQNGRVAAVHTTTGDRVPCRAVVYQGMSVQPHHHRRLPLGGRTPGTALLQDAGRFPGGPGLSPAPVQDRHPRPGGRAHREFRQDGTPAPGTSPSCPSPFSPAVP